MVIMASYLKDYIISSKWQQNMKLLLNVHML
jgi:hypothetical protein